MSAERVINTEHPLFGVLEDTLVKAMEVIGIDQQAIPNHNHDLMHHSTSGYPSTATIYTFFDSIPYAIRFELFLDEEEKTPRWKAADARGMRTDNGTYVDDCVWVFDERGIGVERDYIDITEENVYEEDPSDMVNIRALGKTKEYPMVIKRLVKTV